MKQAFNQFFYEKKIDLLYEYGEGEEVTLHINVLTQRNKVVRLWEWDAIKSLE